jgi:DNA repair protein RecO
VVLRIRPYSNTSHVVHWLSENRGSLVTIVKGALRPRSLFLGQYDIFQTCELLYYSKDSNGVHISKECSSLTKRDILRSRWRAYAAASYAADLLLRVAQPAHADPDLYGLANSFLDTVQFSTAPAETCMWFESRCLAVSGFAPRTDRCAACGIPPSRSDAPGTHWAIVPDRGEILCPRCDGDGAPMERRRMTRESVLAMEQWGRSPRFVPAGERLSTDEMLVTMQVIGRLAELYLHAEPAYRKLAYELSSVREPRGNTPEKTGYENSDIASGRGVSGRRLR